MAVIYFSIHQLLCYHFPPNACTTDARVQLNVSYLLQFIAKSDHNFIIPLFLQL